jgi:hypothetical protein
VRRPPVSRVKPHCADTRLSAHRVHRVPRSSHELAWAQQSAGQRAGRREAAEDGLARARRAHGRHIERAQVDDGLKLEEREQPRGDRPAALLERPLAQRGHHVWWPRLHRRAAHNRVDLVNGGEVDELARHDAVGDGGLEACTQLYEFL